MTEVLTFRTAECAYLQVALPGRPVENAGVLLLDSETGRLHLRLRRDWAEWAGEEADVLESLSEDLALKARDLGGRGLLAYLEDQASNLLRVTERETVRAADFEKRLNRLYHEHVSPKVLPFRTHLPVYSLRAAASFPAAEKEIPVEPDDWVEAPEELRRLSRDMFVCRIEGRSMEPRIPDGSLCVFRRPPAGSREGLWLLIEYRGAVGGRFTVKRYHSEKRLTQESWEHTRIRFEPFNPEFEPWEELAEGEFHVIAQFVRVLPAAE